MDRGARLIGTGTPWEPVPYKGVDYPIGQANNALSTPDRSRDDRLGAEHVTDGMLLAAAEAVAGLVDVDAPGAGLLPDVENLRAASATVAVAVANRRQGRRRASELDDLSAGRPGRDVATGLPASLR